MFAGFNLTITDDSFCDLKQYMHGKTMFVEQRDSVQASLKRITFDKEGFIDATEIEKDWFPEIKADIFISHSHKDEQLAIKLAGWLNDRFNLKCFIDSTVWRSAEDLLNTLDKEYSISSQSNPEKTIYSYNKRNKTTAHVHILLTMALQKMIDKTECLFFLNTSNSIITSEPNSTLKTDSPWIYSELLFSSMVRHKELGLYRKDFHRFGLRPGIEMRYDATTDHLYELNEKELQLMNDLSGNIMPHLALDYLYMKKAII